MRTARLAAALLLVLTVRASADVVTIACDRDNTLYEDAGGLLSNGAGDSFFVGRINLGTLRRGLIHFDLGVIPAGSTITAVEVRLQMAQTVVTDRDVALHRCAASWGEGASIASGNGSQAEPGDATWIHRFYPGTLWASAGGDFAPAASATVQVGGLGVYTWSGAGLVADAQAWLTGGASANHGWVVVGQESGGTSAKRFESRESLTAANRPMIQVTFTPPAPACRVDWDHNTVVQPADVASFVTDWFTSLTQGTLVGDFDGNGQVLPADVATFVGQWFVALSTGSC